MHEYAYKYIRASKMCCANEDEKISRNVTEKNPCSSVLGKACRP